MRTSTDALRSMADYVAKSLGSEWEVRFEDEEGAFDRPFCRVVAATPMQTRVQNVMVVDCRQTFSLVCYPVEKDSAADARLEGERVVELLYQAFAVGTHTASYGALMTASAEVNWRRGHPLRVPLFDFDGVPLTVQVTEDERDPRDFLKVDEPPTFGVIEGTAREDERETLYTVTGDVRVKWTRSIAKGTPGTTVETVTSGPEPPPE